MSVKKIILQLQREIWEYRFSFFWAPLFLIIIPVFGVFMMFYWGPNSAVANSEVFNLEGIYFKNLVVPAQDGSAAYFDFNKAGAFDFFAKFGLAASWLVYTLAYIACALNFAFSCLFADRKSNSILFWRSLPVSEANNVLGKLLVIGFIIPIVLAILCVLCAALILLGGAVYAGDPGLLFSLGKHFFASNVIAYFIGFFWTALLFLPFATWALFMSALVKQHPGVIGILFPVLLWGIDEAVQRLLGFGLGVQALIKGYGKIITGYLSPPDENILGWLFNAHLGKVVMVSLIVSMLFCCVAIWLRNHRYEI